MQGVSQSNPVASGDVKQDDGVSAGQRDPLRLMQTLN